MDDINLINVEVLKIERGEKLILRVDSRVVPPDIVAQIVNEMARFVGKGNAVVIYAPTGSIEIVKVGRDEQAAEKATSQEPRPEGSGGGRAAEGHDGAGQDGALPHSGRPTGRDQTVPKGEVSQ